MSNTIALSVLFPEVDSGYTDGYSIFMRAHTRKVKL